MGGRGAPSPTSVSTQLYSSACRRQGASLNPPTAICSSSRLSLFFGCWPVAWGHVWQEAKSYKLSETMAGGGTQRDSVHTCHALSFISGTFTSK